MRGARCRPPDGCLAPCFRNLLFSARALVATSMTQFPSENADCGTKLLPTNYRTCSEVVRDPTNTYPHLIGRQIRDEEFRRVARPLAGWMRSAAGLKVYDHRGSVDRISTGD
jgi:hypothetical protein